METWKRVFKKIENVCMSELYSTVYYMYELPSHNPTSQAERKDFQPSNRERIMS